MKKNLFYAFALIGSMGFFAACSDDDGKGTINTELLKELNTTFTTGNESASFALTYSDAPMVGKTATFNSADGKTATIVLAGTTMSQLKPILGVDLVNSGVVPGETSTTLNVNLTPVGDTGFAFEGTDGSNGRTLTYKGTIEKGKLSMDVDVAFADNNLTGTWNLFQKKETDNIFPIRMVWNSSVPLLGALQPGAILEIVAQLPLIGEGDNKLPLVTAISALLQNVTFGTDGNIIASYSDTSNMAAPVWQSSPANMLQYVVKDGMVYVYLNVEAIMSAAATSQTSTKSLNLNTILNLLLPKLPEIAPMLTNGIPLGYTVDENGMLGVYIEETQLGAVLVDVVTELLSNEEVLAAIKEMVASTPGMEDMASLIDYVLPQLPATIEATTDMELGLNFTKTTE